MNEATGLSQGQWFKSSYSNGQGGNCVEACRLADGGIAIRDTKDRDGGTLAFPPDDWRAFIAAAARGEFA